MLMIYGMILSNSTSIRSLEKLIQTVHRLRAPNGCPWDQSQTHQSLRQYLIEESYEVLDILDQIHDPKDLQNPQIKAAFREELGDLLMQVLLHSEMASETNAFNVYDVAEALNEKLVRRHPHVFGESKATSPEAALKTWEQEKAKERKKIKSSSILDGVPRHLPALQRAARVVEKVTAVGFDWADIQGPLDKVQEEFNELKHEILNPSPEQKLRIEAELGDLLLTVCHLAFSLKITPEDALRSTLARFEKRFRHVERRLKKRGKTPDQSDLSEMDQLWNEAKTLEKANVWGLSGGIASGKSTVAKIFSQLGLPILDADQISRELTQPGGLAHEAIMKRFGTVDRQQLSNLVFTDPKSKADLETILHPMIQDVSIKQIKELSGKFPAIIYEASLLVESGAYLGFSGLIVVEAPEELRIRRLLARNPFTPEQAKQILASQISEEERRKYANHIFINSQDLASLEREVKAFVEKQGWNLKSSPS